MAIQRKHESMLNTKNNVNLANQNNNLIVEQKVLESIIEERNKIHKTKAILEAGVLTPVTYLSQIINKESGDMINTQAVNNLANSDTLYIKINKLEVKFLENLEIEEDTSELGKSYDHGGNIQVMPNTIQPKENDYFFFKYMDTVNLYRVTKVTVSHITPDSAYNVEFRLADNGENFDYENWVLKKNVQKEYEFIKEYLGTGYRTILENSDKEFVSKVKVLYRHLGQHYIDNFYDADHNIYFLRSKYYFDFHTIKYNTDENDIIIGKNGTNEEYYDEELTQFIRTNDIFENLGFYMMFSPNNVLPRNELHYHNTIFKALEIQDPGRFQNRKLISKLVTHASIRYPHQLYGRYIISHVANAAHDEETELLNPVLEDTIMHFDRSIPFRDRTYSSISNLIAETIGIYIRKEDMNEVFERLAYLSDNTHLLNVDPSGIFPNNAYYLFPMLGYVISKAIEEKLKTFNS